MTSSLLWLPMVGSFLRLDAASVRPDLRPYQGLIHSRPILALPVFMLK